MNIDGREIEIDNLSYSELVELRDYYSGTVYYSVLESVIEDKMLYSNVKRRCTEKKLRKFRKKRQSAHTRHF